MTSQEDDFTGRQCQRKTTSKETTSGEEDFTGFHRKTTLKEDNHIGIKHSQEEDLTERTSQDDSSIGG